MPELRYIELVELNGSDDVDASVSTDGTVRVDIDGSGDVTGRLAADCAAGGDFCAACAGCAVAAGSVAWSMRGA